MRPLHISFPGKFGKAAFVILFGFATLVRLSGCSDEEDSLVEPGSSLNLLASALPFPDTPDQVLANFRTIYESRDTDEYGLILDPAFETLLQLTTQSDFPHVGPELNVAEEIRIHARLFSGEAQADPFGSLVPAILDFSFSRFEKIVDWGLSLPSDPFPDTLSALYDVEILADRGPVYSTLIVRGQIRFYVAPATVLQNGQPVSYYRLVGQLDLTQNSKGLEHVAWGSLKALFY